MSKKSVRGSSKIANLAEVDDVAGSEVTGPDTGATSVAASLTPPLHQSFFTSYSANFEDVILNRIFGKKPNGFYVDIGAAHPMFENDTKLFYDRGWTGINVEPNPNFFELLAAERPRDRNFCLAVTESASDIDFYEVVGTGLSTCDEKQAEIARRKGHRIVKRSVTSATLGSILDQVAPPAIDFMKIDVEGFEQQVLSGNDWSKYRPSVISIEVTYPESPTRRLTTIRDYLEKLGYNWRYFDGLNDFYVAGEFELDGDVFDRPPNVFDGFKLRATVDLEQQVANLSDFRRQTEEYAQELAAALQTSRETGAELQRAIVEIKQQHSDQVASLTAALEASREEIRSLTAAYHSSRADAEDAGRSLAELRDSYSILQVAKNRVRIELANEKFERHNLSVATETMRKELVALHAELERWIADRGELLHLRALRADEAARHNLELSAVKAAENAETARFKAELSSQSAHRDSELQQLRAELGQLRTRLTDAEAARQAMLHSSSWQIMRPYRGVGRALKAVTRLFS
jgi:FkbM family methyltransferase